MSPLEVFLACAAVFFMVMFFLMTHLTNKAQKAAQELLDVNRQLLKNCNEYRDMLQEGHKNFTEAMNMLKTQRTKQEQQS